MRKPSYKLNFRRDLIPIKGMNEYEDRNRHYFTSSFRDNRESQRNINRFARRSTVLVMYDGIILSPIGYLIIIPILNSLESLVK